MTGNPMTTAELATFLGRHPPFVTLGPGPLAELAEAAAVRTFAPGDLVLDAFTEPSVEVFVMVSGQVDLWNDADRTLETADERLGPGGVFGFSAMLTERSVGPRVVACDAVTVATLPAEAVAPVFSSQVGAKFLAAHITVAHAPAAVISYSLVDDLIAEHPLIVTPQTSVSEVAAAMTARGLPYAAVRTEDGRYGLITDADLRRRVLVDRIGADAPAREVMSPDAPHAVLGDSAAEAQILMLDTEVDFLLVTDRDGRLRGVVGPRDFAVSPSTVGVSLHEQLRRAATTDELRRRARRLAPTLADLLSRGLGSDRTIAVGSAMIDTTVRRAITLVFAQHPELSVEAFTWLSLGSNGRREAVLSSDVDSAVAFGSDVAESQVAAYRTVFAEIGTLLSSAGLISDGHGAVAHRPAFSRTNAQWRAAAREWLGAPEKNQGAVMTSLLVDGRPIHGDPGLPAVTRVFGALRRHPMTMRLLLEESLARRAKLHSVKDVLTRRTDTFDIKSQALLPIVNLARWAALSVQSATLSTVERLRAAAGSAMLPQEQATNLIEVFGVLQRVRLRYQLLAQQRGDTPTDLLSMDRLSPIDRSMLQQAVREIAAVQRRMDNLAAYLSPAEWASPAEPS